MADVPDKNRNIKGQNNNNDDDPFNVKLALPSIAQYMNAMTRHQKEKHAPEFTKKFTGDHKQTLDWCHSMDMYMSSNDIEETAGDTYALYQMISTYYQNLKLQPKLALVYPMQKAGTPCQSMWCLL